MKQYCSEGEGEESAREEWESSLKKQEGRETGRKGGNKERDKQEPGMKRKSEAKKRGSDIKEVNVNKSYQRRKEGGKMSVGMRRIRERE